MKVFLSTNSSKERGLTTTAATTYLSTVTNQATQITLLETHRHNCYIKRLFKTNIFFGSSAEVNF